MGLTAKQQRFVEEYLIDLNATQAAIRAGYSEKTANEQAARMLANVSIQEAIRKAMEERSKRTEITADNVLKEFWSIAKDDIKNYLSFRTERVVIGYDEKGNPVSEYRTIADIKDSDTIDTKNISEISIGKDGQFKFKLYCRDNALLQVGKHLGMFNDGKSNVNVNIGVQIVDDIPK
jgi:phage terminase small subunit